MNAGPIQLPPMSIASESADPSIATMVPSRNEMRSACGREGSAVQIRAFVSVVVRPACMERGYATAPMKSQRPASIALLAASLAACDQAPPPTPPAPITPTTASSPAPAEPPTVPAGSVDSSKWRTSTSADDASVVEVAGLRAPKPTSWVWTKPSVQFRTLQYAVAGEADSTKAAELVISVFLEGDGGPLDANIARWRSQFRQGDTSPEPKLSDLEVGPLKVKFIELEGDYMAMGAAAAKRDFSQIGAIVQAPGRNVFFRLIGPKETVEANRADFTKMIEGLMPAD